MSRGSKGKGEAAPAAPAGPSVATHPSAARTLARLKAWAGLLGALAVGLLSLRAGVPAFEAGVRALGAGVVLYLAAWAAGVAFFRQLVLAEVRAEADRRAEERERLAAEARAEAAATGVA